MNKNEKVVYQQIDGVFMADDGAGGGAACSPEFVARVGFTALDGLIVNDGDCDCVSCNVMKAARALLRMRGKVGEYDREMLGNSKLC